MKNVRLCAVLMSAAMGGAIASCSSVAQIIPTASEIPTAEGTSSSSSEGTVDNASDTLTGADPQIFPIHRRFEEGALILEIQEVQLYPNQISIQIRIVNPSDQIVRIYPNEGILSTGIDELEANIFLTDAALSGAIAPREEKSGMLVFSSRFGEDLNLTNVTSFQLSLGQIIDMESITPHIVSLAFSLKSDD